MYGCHSNNSPNRMKSDTVTKGATSWAFRFTKTCQYDKRKEDKRCDGCKHEAKE